MFPTISNDETIKWSCAYNHENPNPNPNPTSRLEYYQDSPFPLHYPSPFLDDNELFLSHIFSPPHLMADHGSGLAETEINITSNPMNIINTEISSTEATDHPEPSKVVLKKKKRISTSSGTAKQRRSGKKDRHSKIYTAQGLRDRRMRLSLQIARKFFDLQDTLGFDKASKTIEWLFSKSKNAIKELNSHINNGENIESSMSECAEDSGILETAKNEKMRKVVVASEEGDELLMDINHGEQKKRKSRKVFNNPIAKEFRNKARARARERTREKMLTRGLEKSKDLCEEANTCNLTQLGFAANPDILDQLKPSSPLQENNSPHVLLHHQRENQGIIYKLLGTSRSSAPCSIFDYEKNETFSSGLDCSNKILGFLGNWDIENPRINCNISATYTNMVPSTSKVYGRNSSSLFMVDSNYHYPSDMHQAD